MTTTIRTVPSEIHFWLSSSYWNTHYVRRCIRSGYGHVAEDVRQ